VIANNSGAASTLMERNRMSIEVEPSNREQEQRTKHRRLHLIPGKRQSFDDESKRPGCPGLNLESKYWTHKSCQ
jgi:hypothetical protein